MSKQIKVTLTDEFAESVKDYQKEYGSRTLAKAVTELAAIGYKTITGKPVPVASNKHGGWRGNEASIEALMAYADRITGEGAYDPIHYNEDTGTFEE